MPPRPKKKALQPCSACWCLQNDFDHKKPKTGDISACVKGTIGGCCVGCCKLGSNVKFSEPGLHNVMASSHESNQDPTADSDFSNFHELKIGGNKQGGQRDTHSLVVCGYLSSTNVAVAEQLDVFLWNIHGAGNLPVSERNSLLGTSYLILGYFSLLFVDNKSGVAGLSCYRHFMNLVLSRLDEIFRTFLGRCESEQQSGAAFKVSTSIVALRVAIADVLRVLESGRLVLIFGGLELGKLLEKRLASLSIELKLFQSSICWEEGDWTRHLPLPLHEFQQSMRVKQILHSLKPHYYPPELDLEPTRSSEHGGYLSNTTSLAINEYNAPRSFTMQTESSNWTQNSGEITFDETMYRATGITYPLQDLYTSKSFGISLETAYPPQDVVSQNFFEHELPPASNEDSFSHLLQLPQQTQFYPTSNDWMSWNEQFNYTWTQ